MYFFFKKNLPNCKNVWDKPLKIQRRKKYFFHKSSSILFRVGSNDQKFYADSKNIYINGLEVVVDKMHLIMEGGGEVLYLTLL